MSSDAIQCQIRLQGHLDRRWSTWFDGLAITWDDDGTTVVAGVVADQPALYGLLQKVRDLGLPLLSLTSCTPAGTDPADPAEPVEPVEPVEPAEPGESS